MPLEKELETFNRELPNLRADNGKFVLIHGDQIVGIFGTYEDALKEGYQNFELAPFLVKQIQEAQQIQFITRMLDAPCHI